MFVKLGLIRLLKYKTLFTLEIKGRTLNVIYNIRLIFMFYNFETNFQIICKSQYIIRTTKCTRIVLS